MVTLIENWCQVTNSSWPSSPCDGANPARAIASLLLSGQENPGVKTQLEDKVKINVV